MKLQPLVRIVLTALAAGLGAAATQIDNETLRIVAAVLVPTLAAIGIVPPTLPVETKVIRRVDDDSAVYGADLSAEDGLTTLEIIGLLCLGGIIVVIVLIV